jgi:ATP-dependent Clp protease ATP-binding subunit ClpB
LGFQVPTEADAAHDEKQAARICRTGVAAARSKFTPEFINRLDRIVVFKSLGVEELRRIVDIELELLQARIRAATSDKPFLLDMSDSAKSFLLAQGTDLNYGARPLKRAIERLIVQPLSNLIATGQVLGGDRLCVSHRQGSSQLSFFRETRAAETWDVVAA